MIIFTLFACNQAPIDYSPSDFAPRGAAPYAHPSETFCPERDTGIVDYPVIDGFRFCNYSPTGKKIPVDDPIYTPCSDAKYTPEPVFYVTDGVRARAYQIQALDQREIVNDQWGAESVLVDF